MNSNSNFEIVANWYQSNKQTYHEKHHLSNQLGYIFDEPELIAQLENEIVLALDDARLKREPGYCL